MNGKIRNARIILLLSIFILVFLPRADAVTLDELLEKIESKQNKIVDITVVQESKNDFSRIEMIYRKGDKWRVDMNMPEFGSSIKSIAFYDGEVIRMWSPTMRMTQIAEESDESYTPLWLKYWKEIKNLDAKITGKENIGDRIGYKVEWETQYGSNMAIWVEEDKANILKFSTPGTNIILSDFREVEPYGEIPYKTEVFYKFYKEGKLDQIIEVKKIEINKGIPDSIFDPDEIESQMQKELKIMESEMFGIPLTKP